ncbi:right-handed parallel beta-helix repeat-containing protein [Bradymonas sediminis]|uniref:Right handed beta helix domain-containing protein n=1 Tax=Bradymonas sediminis TaxID=1548548 RepID=A0A2Z4FGF6_9DELT|nr:right-handed parallel beta-helix repeat-containing protein [Bradymonas sediminis]AWV88019.1 hypothetical protein DN745_01200 [Bradymonas sediminis]TDP77142.1 parallel beta helix pectate lyase-like protein [Bradymonas sediminis]
MRNFKFYLSTLALHARVLGGFLLAASLAVGCGDSPSRDAGSGYDAGDAGGVGDAGDVGTGDADADAGGTENNSPGEFELAGCTSAARGAQPSAQLPQVTNRESEYQIELERWGIHADGTHAQETTDGLNEALAWAKQNGHGTVRLGAGTYLVGEEINAQYAGGVVLPGGLVFALDPDAVIQMAPNDRWNYCVVAVVGAQDVIITGGQIRGERDAHTFAGGGAHDEGHTICIERESERVLVENTRLSHGTGDGVLIVGAGEAGSSSKHITIRKNEIFNHRRQGVSIVGGTNIVVEENEIHHISGVAPQFGVDIESLHYKSQDILIRGNHFHQNQGGDYVNTDGRNVWLVDNIMDQTGLQERQTDGPVVHWAETDQVIRNNTITVTVGSSNGRWAIIGYGSDRETTAVNYIEDNVFHGGGIHMANTRRMQVTGNTVKDWQILGTDVSCLKFDDNAVEYDGGEPYKFRNMYGEASGNTLNGEPVDLAFSPDSPFTNSPPHMW